MGVNGGTMQATSRGFYDDRGQSSYPSSSGRYRAYDPAEFQSYSNQASYQDVPADERPSRDSSYDQEYRTRDRDGPASQGYYPGYEEGWDPAGYGQAAQQEGVRGGQWGGEYTGQQQIFDVYSQQENDFLPQDGEAVVEAEQAANSRVMDEVESFYNRPESVVEDVEKFYDARGQQIEGLHEVRHFLTC